MLKTKLQELRKKAGYKSARAFADKLKVSLDELAGREWPRPPSAIEDDESRLLSLYRDTDQRGKAAIMRTAEGEAGMEGQAPPAVSETA